MSAQTKVVDKCVFYRMCSNFLSQQLLFATWICGGDDLNYVGFDCLFNAKLYYSWLGFPMDLLEGRVAQRLSVQT